MSSNRLNMLEHKLRHSIPMVLKSLIVPTPQWPLRSLREDGHFATDRDCKDLLAVPLRFMRIPEKNGKIIRFVRLLMGIRWN